MLIWSSGGYFPHVFFTRVVNSIGFPHTIFCLSRGIPLDFPMLGSPFSRGYPRGSLATPMGVCFFCSRTFEMLACGACIHTFFLLTPLHRSQDAVINANAFTDVPSSCPPRRSLADFLSATALNANVLIDVPFSCLPRGSLAVVLSASALVLIVSLTLFQLLLVFIAWLCSSLLVLP